MDDSCLLVDASRSGSPRVERIWTTPGARGVISTRQGLWAWGPAGVSRLDANDAKGAGMPHEGRARTAVLDAATGGGWIILLQPDFVLVCNDHGGEVARLPMENVHAVGFAGATFVTASHRGLRMHKLNERGRIDRGKLFADWPVQQLVSAQGTGSLFARRDENHWTEILPDMRIGATYADMPWEVSSASTGAYLARLGGGAALELYRVPKAPQLALPRPEARSTQT
ncbi:hypothetical protein AWB67_06884 [Caballeronia terrestris]|uniref:Uncharacterized protein n=1 Tax=Caballeronia terrestris TaxID=1226301 RepID=A0A158KX88_9BURK|nr:hypothetical protein [Caballeronia terrestris]SAL85220.1 hypothetical protein AWB67_06884 [Caballeronia terrestris]